MALRLLLAMLCMVTLTSCGSSTGEPLVILVTNDDGFDAPGIDAIVEALRDDPKYGITVVAPLEDRSGSSDETSDPPPATAMSLTTLSGFPAFAVDGFPADSVIYALDNLYDDPPHLVISGANSTQNVGTLAIFSGTVGAAQTAARRGVPAIAVSQGEGEVIDYPASVAEVMRWLDEHRKELLDDPPAPTSIDSINVPSCDSGEIRGRVEVPTAFVLMGRDPQARQDCNSMLEDPKDDVEALLNGFVAISEIEI